MARSDAGRLVLVVGPSGAGKDTLIAGARAAFENDPRFVFVRRAVTRPEGAHEQHDTLSEEAFAEAEARGAFALSWRAHGLAYGVPATIAADLTAGRIVIVNTSRKVIEQARSSFTNVIVLLVTAPPAVLAARIAARGRDTASGSRVDATRADGFAPDVTIVNDRDPCTAIDELVGMLKAF